MYIHVCATGFLQELKNFVALRRARHRVGAAASLPRIFVPQFPSRMCLTLPPLEPVETSDKKEAQLPLPEWLHAALHLAYGDAAANSVIEDIGAFCQASTRLASAAAEEPSTAPGAAPARRRASIPRRPGPRAADCRLPRSAGARARRSRQARHRQGVGVVAPGTRDVPGWSRGVPKNAADYKLSRCGGHVPTLAFQTPRVPRRRRYLAVLAALSRVLGPAVTYDLDASGLMPNLPFAWRSGLPGASEVARSPSLRLEQAAATYNLAAAHAACGALLPRSDVDAIKAAARHFTLAAGAMGELAALNVREILE
jgi:hypothetical protein